MRIVSLPDPDRSQENHCRALTIFLLQDQGSISGSKTAPSPACRGILINKTKSDVSSGRNIGRPIKCQRGSGALNKVPKRVGRENHMAQRREGRIGDTGENLEWIKIS